MFRILLIAVTGLFFAVGSAQAEGGCSGYDKGKQQSVQQDQSKKPATTS